jgi:hypothetical protein
MNEQEIKELEIELAKLEKENILTQKKIELQEKIENLKKSKAPDTKIKRMGRGFKVIFSKLKSGYTSVVNSNYVQNIKAEQDSGVDSDTYMAILPGEELPKKKSKIKVRKEDNPFATDLTNTQTDL